MRRDELFLQHIHEEAAFLLDACADLTYEQLLADPVLQRAIVRSIEVIGEATKNVSDERKKQYPDVPWKLIAGARDKLIHAYFDVDWRIVWNILQSEIPALEQSVLIILNDIESS